MAADANLYAIMHIFDRFFPLFLSLDQGIYILLALAGILPLLRLSQNQLRAPRQHRPTGWRTAAEKIFMESILPDGDNGGPTNDDSGVWADDSATALNDEEVMHLAGSVETIADYLGWLENDATSPLLSREGLRRLLPAPILVTPHMNCVFCSTPSNIVPLHRGDMHKV